MTVQKRYNDLNSYLRNLFGCRVQKITIDAGLTCPNRDGTISSGGCIYCNIRGSGTGAHANGLTVTQQLSNGKKSLSKRYKAKKFIAYLVLALAYIVPFNFAYFAPPDTGKGALTSFLFVILGCVIFTVMMFKQELKEEREGGAGAVYH